MKGRQSMKELRLVILSALIIALLGGCSQNKQKSSNITVTPSQQPMVTLQPTKVMDEDTSGADAKQNINKEDLLEYFPIQADTTYVYEGKGNEYASYTRIADFIDNANNKIQTRSDNGGTETVEVIEVKDGKVTILNTIHECYYRDNFMDKTNAGTKKEVLLMEPLVKGTKWTLPDGGRRSISAIDADVDTPSGKYKAIEVTTREKGNSGITKDYYAPKVGLVKSVYSSGKLGISSVLKEIRTDTPFKQTINIYYPDTDEKIHVEPLTLSFRTNDITRLALQETLRKDAVKKSYLPLISAKTKINSMYLGEDSIVYADFSADLVNDMNLGSGFESAVLQCITNTLGNYYGVEKVYITVNQKPYESGHILMKKGETFRVSMENVVK